MFQRNTGLFPLLNVKVSTFSYIDAFEKVYFSIQYLVGEHVSTGVSA